MRIRGSYNRNLCRLHFLHVTLDKIIVVGRDRVGPEIDPFGHRDRHVDAAVTARQAVIVVPVCAVNGDAVVSEERVPGHAGQIEPRAGIALGFRGAHVAAGHLQDGAELAARQDR